MLELAQRGQQRGLDVLGIGAGAEVNEQFAHVAVAFAHAGVDLAQRPLQLLRIAVGERLAHQMHLDLEKCQRLRDGIVQFARQERALLRDRRLLLERIEAQVLHRTGQVGGQRFQQRAFRGRQAELVVKEEIHFAHQAIVLRNRNRNDVSNPASLQWRISDDGIGLDRDDAYSKRQPMASRRSNLPP